MDDQTEVPEQYVVLFVQRGEENASDPESYQGAKDRASVMDMENDIEVLAIMTEEGYRLRSEKGAKYRVKYQDAGLTGPSYTQPMTGLQAQTRVALMHTQDGISDVEIVAAETIMDETSSAFRLEGTDEHQRILQDAQRFRQTQREQVAGDLDASLDEPAIGAFSKFPEEPTEEQLDGWEKELKEDEGMSKACAPSIDTWSQKQNRHTALNHAMELATRVPMGGMSVVVSGQTAEKVIENARLFLAFLNEEGTGA